LSRCRDAFRLCQLINMMRRFGQNGMCALVLLLAVLWGGCQTDSDSATPQAGTSSANTAAGTAAAGNTNSVFSIDRIAVGDVIRVMYEASVPIAPTEIQVPETGLVTIHMGEQVQVADKMAADVSKEIRDLFTVKKQMYKRLSVNVQVLGRTVSVGGEVRTTGSFAFEGGMTVLKAINRAGGFTEYADRRKVRITRVNGQQIMVDCKLALKKPDLDVPLYPGDRIEVVRSIL
jgi:protein involved in polysaccharide export with SLBB domain